MRLLSRGRMPPSDWGLTAWFKPVRPSAPGRWVRSTKVYRMGDKGVADSRPDVVAGRVVASNLEGGDDNKGIVR